MAKNCAIILIDTNVYMQSKNLMSAYSDPLIDYAAGLWTGPVVRKLGLPTPIQLKRESGPYRLTELEGRGIATGAVTGGYAIEAAKVALQKMGGVPRPGPVWDTRTKVDVAVFDATGCQDVASLSHLRVFFAPLMRQLAQCARIVVLAADPLECEHPIERAAATGVEGFVRTLAKEVGRNGSTANLLYVSRNAVERLDGPLRFFCSYRTAYVSGRPVRITNEAKLTPTVNQVLRLKDKVTVVTGAARGLGRATAVRLAEEGAKVICIDVPSSKPVLDDLAAQLGGVSFPLDITAPDAPAQLVSLVRTSYGGIDVVIHNAGITRDRMLVNMTEIQWELVMAVNLKAIIDIDAAIDAEGLMRDDSREVCLSSISGIAGNAGQSNYAVSKAALMGYASARAAQHAGKGITVNCVAPGFIETEMTKQIPLMIREAGRRMNALSQGGQPRDVAELVTFLALPESSGVTGQTIRVCGQALLGA
jgi:3-oxoacyl-[acyl-carrier protein] reductase